ncbi:MAG: hypothetical protein M9934_01665 [Thermomicrobiales bacterium]|nr:hypothetical protein [Thermomicrobiales bacterium]
MESSNAANVGITTVYDCGPSQDGDGNLSVIVNDGSATYQGSMENCTYTFFGTMLVSGVLYKSNEISLTPVAPTLHLTINDSDADREVPLGTSLNFVFTGPWSAGNPNVGITTVYDCGPSQDGDGNLSVIVNDGSATYQGSMENCTYTFFGTMLVSGVLYKSNEISLTPVAPDITLTANDSNREATVQINEPVNFVTLPVPGRQTIPPLLHHPSVYRR